MPENDISTSLESLGEEIKNTAEKNKCIQSLERSTNTTKSSSFEQGNKSQAELLNSSYNGSLLQRVHKAQEEIRKDIHEPENNQVVNKNKSTPNINQNNERKIFGTPNHAGFRFKTPNTGKITPSAKRAGGQISGNHFGTKNIGNNSGHGAIPSYQRETTSSTLKKSPTKVYKY